MTRLDSSWSGSWKPEVPFEAQRWDGALRRPSPRSRQTIKHYRERIHQADAMAEFALSEVLRGIIVQEQEHLQDLSDALGIEAPEIS